MSNILKPATIIPEHLYVERDADRQLKKIVDNMGRPAYVLVARQMGKTNLLLHAKKKYSNNNDIFVYVDLSNIANSSRACFRGIIDTAIESHKEVFLDISSKIINLRKENFEISPHKEHDLELKVLLSKIYGKLVILLDEVDALTKADYSDEIFAQIRSIYFSRINFPEAERLTYVLSGVAEPSELIKNKKISPFNIGTKIYLEDFSYDEYISFLRKANFSVAEDVVNRIFYWTSGHPRMTWDVCSNLEDLNDNGCEIKSADVDSVVNNLYLDSFDTAPVDHIRDIAQKNIEIRRAILAIKTNQGTLTDNVKKKLYLSGIIKSPTAEGEILLKNEIISRCLSQSWLAGIDNESRNLLALGVEQLEIGNFRDAISCFNDLVEDYQVKNKSIIYGYIGHCYSRLGEYRTSIDYFKKCSFDSVSESNEYYGNLFKTALSYYNLQEYETSLVVFKEILDNHKSSILKCKAFLNYGSALINDNFYENKEKALGIFKDLLKDLEVIKFSDISELNEMKVIAYYNIGNIYEEEKDKESAIYYLKQAIDVQYVRYIPGLVFELYKLDKYEFVNTGYINTVINAIVDNKLKVDDDTSDYLAEGVDVLRFTKNLLTELLIVAYDADIEIRKKFYGYVIRNIFTKYKNINDLIYGLANYAKNVNNKFILKSISEVISYCIDNNDDLLLINSLRIRGLAKYNLNRVFIRDLEEYAKLLSKYKSSFEFSDDDIIAFTLIVLNFKNNKEINKALYYYEISERFFDSIPNNTNFVGLIYLASQLYISLKKWKYAVNYAKKALDILDKRESNDSTVIDVQQIEEIKIQCIELSKKINFMQPNENMKKFGRNEPCPCGSGLKYKKCCGNQ